MFHIFFSSYIDANKNSNRDPVSVRLLAVFVDCNSWLMLSQKVRQLAPAD